jgi:hypothetical protein
MFTFTSTFTAICLELIYRFLADALSLPSVTAFFFRMTEMIQSCPVLQTTSDWQALLSVPRSEVNTDWWGGRLERPFRYSISRDTTHLAFVAEVPKAPSVLNIEQHGRFVADLAEPETGGDTAELFIMRDDRSYFEVHITAQGAWWYMDFESYRDRRLGNDIPMGVQVHIVRESDSWLGAIRLPLDKLKVLPGAEVGFQATLALCGGPTPVYISSGGVPGFEADFHDSRVFQRLRL